uniref:Synuclein, alpha interacting protein n=1 Tax=Xiphophorus couchianus TaxID=32473 RepID=A0A3B5MMN4_9TELE
MEAPEYLDLDEIDFSDDSYSVTSLKNIPELSRRSDGPAEERPGEQLDRTGPDRTGPDRTVGSWKPVQINVSAAF